MAAPTLHLRGLARRITAAYLRHTALSGAILTGSGARGDADRYSDLDLTCTSKTSRRDTKVSDT